MAIMHGVISLPENVAETPDGAKPIIAATLASSQAGEEYGRQRD